MSQIIWSSHLNLKFGTKIGWSLNSENVLEAAATYCLTLTFVYMTLCYLNTWIQIWIKQLKCDAHIGSWFPPKSVHPTLWHPLSLMLHHALTLVCSLCFPLLLISLKHAMLLLDLPWPRAVWAALQRPHLLCSVLWACIVSEQHFRGYFHCSVFCGSRIVSGPPFWVLYCLVVYITL